MRELKIFIAGTRQDMQPERQALRRALMSLNLEGARIDARYADEEDSRESIMSHVDQCDVYVGLYDRTRYGGIDPESGVSTSELEFDEALRMEKPLLVFVKLLREGQRSDPTQSAFLDRVMRAGRENVRVSELAEPDQLEELAAESLVALIPTRFGIQTSRPVFQAPNRLETFVGREPQIEKLVAALSAGRTVLIHGVGAVGGMGKTELAAHIAHELRGQFVDGVLWADIQSARASDLLFQWARTFGGFASLSRSDLRFEYHTQSDEDRRISEMAIRAEELHRVISGKRVLVVLDGAIDEEDDLKIAPLMKALGGCAVAVTSRTRRLRSLTAPTLIDLEPMNATEALDLLSRIVGSNRVQDQSALVAEIASVVDSLPLALDLAASLLRDRPSMQAGTLLEYLRAEREPLEATGWGYRYLRGMQASLNVSYAFLNDEEKAFFAALGVFISGDFSVEAAAAAAGTTPAAAAPRLEQLRRRSLVQNRRQTSRYQIHPVVRSYARDKLQDPDAELRIARHYRGLAQDYGRRLLGSETHYAHSVLTAELCNLITGHDLARKRNDRAGWELCRDFVLGAMAYYFNVNAMWSDWVNWCQLGLDACRKLKDERSAIAIVSSLGVVYQRRGDWKQAVEFYRNALALMEGFGTQAGMAEIYMHLGATLTQQEEWSRALAALTKSMQIRQKLGDARGLAESRANLGMLYAKHGETVKARALWNQALEVLDSLGSRNEADIVRRWLKSLPRDR